MESGWLLIVRLNCLRSDLLDQERRVALAVRISTSRTDWQRQPACDFYPPMHNFRRLLERLAPLPLPQRSRWRAAAAALRRLTPTEQLR